MTKLIDIFEAKINGTASPLAEANKNTGKVKLKPWATELAPIIEKAYPNVDFGIGGMGGEGITLDKQQYKAMIAAFKEAGYKVVKGQHGFVGEFIYSKEDPKKGVFITRDPWEEGDDNLYGMVWQD